LGKIVIELPRSVLATLDEIQNVANNAEANLGGLIRLGVVPTFGPYFLSRVLPRLHANYPELEPYVRERRPHELKRSLADGKLDCALTRPPDTESRLAFHELTAENLRLGVPADHTLAQENTIRPAMLKGQRMLTLAPDYPLNCFVQTLCQSSGATINDDYEGTILDAVRQMVSIGMGQSLFPDLYIESKFPKENRVVLWDIEGNRLTRSIVLVWPSGSVRSQQYLRLLEECRKALDQE
jgi:LysR family hydrogen peroxide-inducible transcriptional activator